MAQVTKQDILDDANAVATANDALPALRQAHSDAVTALGQAQATAASAIKTVTDQQNALVAQAQQALTTADGNLSVALQNEKNQLDKLVADATSLVSQDQDAGDDDSEDDGDDSGDAATSASS